MRFSPVLAPCIETRWREAGYPTFSDYVTGLIRYDLLLLGPHIYYNGDDTDPENSSIELTIPVLGIDTREPQRDAHLRSADFFDVEKFPLLTFKSTSVAVRDDNQFDVTGELTIRDVTKTIVLPVSYLGAAKDPWGADKVAFETEITLNRKDYGLNWNAALEAGGFLVGDEVKVSLSIQAA